MAGFFDRLQRIFLVPPNLSLFHRLLPVAGLVFAVTVSIARMVFLA